MIHFPSLLIGRVRLQVNSPISVWDTFQALLQQLDAFEVSNLAFDGHQGSFSIKGEIIAYGINWGVACVSGGGVQVEIAPGGARIHFDLDVRRIMLLVLAISTVSYFALGRSILVAMGLFLTLVIWIVSEIVIGFTAIGPQFNHSPSLEPTKMSVPILLILFILLGACWFQFFLPSFAPSDRAFDAASAILFLLLPPALFAAVKARRELRARNRL